MSFFVSTLLTRATFHLHDRFIRNILAPRHILTLNPLLILLVGWNYYHAPTLETLKGSSLATLGVREYVCLEIGKFSTPW